MPSLIAIAIAWKRWIHCFFRSLFDQLLLVSLCPFFTSTKPPVRVQIEGKFHSWRSVTANEWVKRLTCRHLRQDWPKSQRPRSRRNGHDHNTNAGDMAPTYRVEELLAVRQSVSESAVSLEKFGDEDAIKGSSLSQHSLKLQNLLPATEFSPPILQHISCLLL